MKNVTYISASAGSGKTFELTERLKKVILSGECKAEEVILTTFTKAAASEFKEKAKAKFYEAGNIKEANQLDQALIGTVDSVANDFVKRYWYLLGISPQLNVISEDDEKIYISQSLTNLPTEEQTEFFNKFAELFKPQVVKDNKNQGTNYRFWEDDLKKVVEKTKSYNIKDYSESKKASKSIIEGLCLKHSRLDYDRDELVLEINAVNEIVQEEKETKTKKERKEVIRKLIMVVENKESSMLDIGMALAELSIDDFKPKSYSNSSEFQDLLKKSNMFWRSEEVRDYQIKYVEYLFDIADQWQEEYLKFKQENHIIDYADMEEYFLELITKEEYKSVQEDITRSYKYLFVDEFQDCSPTQIKIFDRLSELVEHSVWVGDYKQSIYGFRGSDINLVKAVTDRIEKLNGKPNETLDTSHRSWPPIVDVSNKIFVPAFKDILRREEVELNYWDRLEEKYRKSKRENLLKCWPFEGKNKDEISSMVAKKIAKMIQDGVVPKDIAVLSRTKSTLQKIATNLKELNIPFFIAEADNEKSREVELLDALLNIVVNPQDTMARATVAYLTQKGYGAAEILDNRFESIYREERDSDYLKEVELISKILSKRREYKNQSVASLVESIIIEMDLYSIVSSWPENNNSISSLHGIIKTAREYEDYCRQLCIPSTIYGFIDYENEVKTRSVGNSEGVQLFTYHGSKGLEWKNVILLSLDDDFLEEKKLIKMDIYGVNTHRDKASNEDDIYPGMNITVLPWIFGRKKKIPESLIEEIKKFPLYQEVIEEKIQEETRLMYVAMTRPVESLILAVKKEDGLKRLECMNMKVTNSLPEEESADILNIGKPFVIEEDEVEEGWKYNAQNNKIINPYNKKVEFKKRDQQPSSYKTGKEVNASIVHDTARRITLKAKAEEMDRVGTCLHDIFCVIENNKDKAFVERIIREHQMENAIPNATEVIEAWNSLEVFLTKTYGPKVNSYHELPFKEEHEGQIFTGSIDLAWETKEGVVLVDYKSYPGDKADVVNKEHAHYAGMYAGQFECYERVLKESGKRVLAKIICYHVLGAIVKLL